jgi:hypothetical protein
MYETYDFISVCVFFQNHKMEALRDRIVVERILIIIQVKIPKKYYFFTYDVCSANILRFDCSVFQLRRHLSSQPMINVFFIEQSIINDMKGRRL